MREKMNQMAATDVAREARRLPVVAIVGRPNVGKSTLFNRIIRRRDAIVDDRPGVTRDRHYAQADWAGHGFVLVDTGGYLPRAQAEMDRAIREQVEIALQEADLILFLVDRQTGCTDIDMEIAQMLHRQQKPILLVVNKVDNQLLEAEAYHFYQLGLGEPVAVSAIQGRAIGDMLDRLVERFQQLAPQFRPEPAALKLAIVGRENVGKSSFVNTLVGQARSIVTPIPGTTRDPVDTIFKYQKQRFLLIDTAGLKRKARVKENLLFYSQIRTLKSIQRADVVLVFADASEGLTRQDLRILNDAMEAHKPAVLVMNKWDLVLKDEKTYHRLEKALAERLGNLKFIPVIFTSVLEKKRLYRVIDLAVEVHGQNHQKVRTSELNRVLLPLVQQNSPPAVRGKEIKLNYVTQVQVAPPVFAFFGNHPELIPPAYRRFLENQIRTHWGFRGVPIRVVFKAKH